jgi:hypothetical protein
MSTRHNLDSSRTLSRYNSKPTIETVSLSNPMKDVLNRTRVVL